MTHMAMRSPPLHSRCGSLLTPLLAAAHFDASDTVLPPQTTDLDQFRDGEVRAKHRK
jgi:hypothetical protein